MRTILSVCLCLGIIIFSVLPAVAQQDSSRRNNDSLNAVILHDFNVKFAGIEQQKVADSIKQMEIKEMLNSLKTQDYLKKDELEKQLRELKDNEAKRISLKKVQIDSMRSTAKAFPVEGFFNDTLFLIYSKLGSFSASDRGKAISDRIHKLADHFWFRSDSLKIVEIEGTSDIVIGETIIMSISENDAIWQNSTKHELAKRYQKLISDAVMKYKEETSFMTLAKEVGLALLVLLIAGGLIFYTRKLFRWTEGVIHRQEGKRIKGIKIKSYTLFDVKRQVKVLLVANTTLKWIIFLFIVYAALPVLFGIFPWTKNLADVLFGYILNPVKKIALAFWDYFPNLITIVVILIVFRYVTKGVHFIKTEIEKGNLQIPGFYTDWANPTYQIVRILLFAFLIVVLFPYLPGSDSPVFKGVSVFLGFLFTFGSAGSLSNIIAGLILTYMRLFKIGDRVKIGEVVGDVIEKSLLVTRIRTIKNEVISIPNSTVMNSHTVNYSSDAPDKGLIIHTTVTIGYDVPWRDIHQALMDAALKTELILHEPAPFVLQTSLDDFYVSYQINGYIKEPNKQATIYSSLHQNIQDVCNERGIEILSPHYRSERDGNMTSIPASYLPKDYQAPSFKINVSKGPAE